MGVCSCSSKAVIIFINIFFLIGAALMIYGGVTYLQKVDDVVEEAHDTRPAYFIFGIASILLICGLIGIGGALSEKKLLLGIFAVVVFATLVLLVAASAVLFVKHDAAMKTTDDFVVKEYNHYGNPNLTVGLVTGTVVETTTAPKGEATTPTSGSGSGTTNTTASVDVTTATVTTAVPATTAAPKGDTNATEFIDSIQTSLECCGWNNYSEWNTYDYWTETLKNNGYVPASCCNKTYADAKNESCPAYMINMKMKNLIYSKDCKTEVEKVVEFGYKFLNWTAVAFAILVFLGFAAAIFLIRRKRSSDGFNYSSIVA